MSSQDLILYGAQRCHKTKYYKQFIQNLGLDLVFKDVEENKSHEEELRNLYNNGKLNFPTFLIKGKKLRNPSEKDLLKHLKNRELI